MNKNLYTLALLATESQFSCKAAAFNLGKRWSHDTLRRALDAPVSFDPNTLAEGDLVVDDVIVDKSYSQAIEGVSTIYSPGDNRYVKGYALVVFMWHGVDGSRRVLQVSPWYAQGEHTKNVLFRQAIKLLFKQGISPRRICFDSWYASSENLNMLNDMGWLYACRMKKNRYLNGQKIHAYRYWGAKSQHGLLKGVSHEVQVVKDGQRFLMTNARQQVNPARLKGWYKRRWAIEELFRELKQCLHLEHCHCRSFAQQVQHVSHAISGWQYLRDNYPNESLYAAKREVLYLARYDKTWPDAFLNRAA